MYFLFTASGLSWRQGQEECERLGGYLAQIMTEDQQNFLVKRKEMDLLIVMNLEKLGNVGRNFNQPQELANR